MNRHQAHGRAALALAGALALALSACSSDDGTPGATTVATSTTGGMREPGAGRSAADLTAILPAAADLGEGWVERPATQAGAGGDRTPADRAIEEQCPELSTLVGAADEPGDDGPVTRTFVDGDGRLLRFELDPQAPARQDTELQEAVDATNECEPIVAEDVPADDIDGATTTMRFQAAIDPDHGEQAVKLQAEIGLLLPSEDDPVLTTLYALVFRTGSVGVRITATDGLDLESLEVARTDLDLVAGLSDRLEASVDDLAS